MTQIDLNAMLSSRKVPSTRYGLVKGPSCSPDSRGEHAAAYTPGQWHDHVSTRFCFYLINHMVYIRCAAGFYILCMVLAFGYAQPQHFSPHGKAHVHTPSKDFALLLLGTSSS